MSRTWREWLTSPEMWFGDLTREQRLWNATRWRVECSNWLLERGDVLPGRFRFAYDDRHNMRDCSVFALPPLHLILQARHWWLRHRYDLERWGLLNGLYQMPEEAIILSEGRWRWPCDIPAGGRRRVCNEWPRAKQLDWHERGIVWADNVPEEKLCS